MATIVLDQQVRNGAFDSGSIPVPDGSQFVILASTMSDADASDTGKSARLAIFLSYDDGQSYYSDPGWQTEWTGGADKFGNPKMPNLGVSAQSDPRPDSPTYAQNPNRAKASIDTEGFSLNCGLTLEAR